MENNELTAMRTKIEELEAENVRLRGEVEQNQSRFVELEHHNSNLASLYVASVQLHETLDREAVVTALQEIIVNLVGSESFGIFICDEGGALNMLAEVGESDTSTLATLNEVRHVLETGEPWVGDPAAASKIVACVPLKLGGRVTGVMVIHKLLAHKAAFEPLDHELFTLLGTHAATALYCTSLHERTRETLTS
jgi:nitrate/nitrite-specific signal transduction histidine kinase